VRLNIVISVGGTPWAERSGIAQLAPGRPRSAAWLRRHAFWLGLGLFAAATIAAAHRFAPEDPMYLRWGRDPQAKINPAAVVVRRPAGVRIPTV
jgi:hypothetical protein